METETSNNTNVEDTTSTTTTATDKPQQQKRKKAIKPYHRIKAHSNPLSDNDFNYPVSPDKMDWSPHYPQFLKDHPEKRVEVADVGCGYGGLTVSLSAALPDQMILGMEIRDKVVQYVDERIVKLREKETDKYQNISVLKTNAMKYLPNYFYKGQLQKIFFLFPDPHFKKANHKRRIISSTLLSEYAYVLAPGGLAYFISDVEELYLWMYKHFAAHPLFEQIEDQQILLSDPCIPLIINSSEEARKVNRIDGKKWYAVFRRITEPRIINKTN
ncbi:tRNA (guanine-N7-)-methyltransferase [Cavenderia fasciculata]|uniref:tRNA (guanine-N(7)-)-methyltransferase n=1 Tax=Cavenderia fasciculata TaxID=261658 RepID=F4QDJ5_CACFS|nr:tRNA (guanine-N7-)-methyltransferase [Cavenderia fasciculata]EGG13792.1 tRNA (guanine-N7-)-methyltransferase [Cavenderia fasciculata]|eukprot:XP_004350500.1 tRNA (guanine-N7-)-methyltransferase [Cavenderia fasciculata]